MEAIILAGGHATRLGDAARGNPKALVPIAGHPLAEYQVSQLVRAGVDRVIVSCGRGQAALFEAKLSGLGARSSPSPSRSRSGAGEACASPLSTARSRGRSMRSTATSCMTSICARSCRRTRSTAAPRRSSLLRSSRNSASSSSETTTASTGFREAPRLPHWVNAGVYVLDDEALARMPELGDHEQSTFPELAAEGKLFGFRHEGLWITVNTPKDLQRAKEHYEAHPELRPTLARGRS